MATVRKRTRRVRQPAANSGQAGMIVRSMDLASLVPYERNPRKRPKEAVAAVAASLKKFGWQQPIVVDSKNVISVGHTRHAAALSLGWTTAPVVVIPDDQAAAYRLVDNRSGEFTVWDNDLLRAELDALPSLDGFDLEVFDFDALLPARGLTDPDDIPETPKNPVARTGDLWVLGKHRIVCGDSTNQETVERLLDGAKPDLMVTDPPYGVNYDSMWRYKIGKNTKGGSYGKSVNDDENDWEAARRSRRPSSARPCAGKHGGESPRRRAACGASFRGRPAAGRRGGCRRPSATPG